MISLSELRRIIKTEHPRKKTLGSSFTHGAVTVGTTATLIKSANANRRSLLIQNLGEGNIFIGGSTVTTGNGIKISAGGSIVIDNTTAAIYGIAAAAQDVRYFEEED